VTTPSYAWNTESELKSAAGVSYTYDGDGRRASKSSGKLYWYGSGGDILAETDASGNTTAEYIFFAGKRIAMLPAGSSAQFYVEDLLGTSRVITTNTGVVCYDADFYPFGGERAYTDTCPQNYKFEGKERDTETGNDDFGARYYSNRFGRWLSADWSAVPVPVPYANLTNPQTLNLYSMVADDPESFADLDGHECVTLPPVQNTCATNNNTPPIQGEGTTEGSNRTGTGESSSAETQVQAQAAAQANATQQAQQQSPAQMSSLQFLGQELKGVYDVTAGPIVNAVEHPIQTVKNAASDLVEGVNDVAKDPKGTLTTAASEAKDQAVAFGKEVASGNPRAIGQAAGLVIDTFIAVRAVQGAEIKVGDNLRIAPTGNRTGHPVGRFPHYHHRIVGPNGKTVPGGSMKWHRPWEP
jgi:RHS repeat-associated protein